LGARQQPDPRGCTKRARKICTANPPGNLQSPGNVRATRDRPAAAL